MITILRIHGNGAVLTLIRDSLYACSHQALIETARVRRLVEAGHSPGTADLLGAFSRSLLPARASHPERLRRDRKTFWLRASLAIYG
jgi:hypothetical protein